MSSPWIPKQPCVVEVCAVEQRPFDVDINVLDQWCLHTHFIWVAVRVKVLLLLEVTTEAVAFRASLT